MDNLDRAEQIRRSLRPDRRFSSEPYDTIDAHVNQIVDKQLGRDGTPGPSMYENLSHNDLTYETEAFKEVKLQRMAAGLGSHKEKILRMLGNPDMSLENREAIAREARGLKVAEELIKRAMGNAYDRKPHNPNFLEWLFGL